MKTAKVENTKKTVRKEGKKKMGENAACVWSWAARAPGPASVCMHNPVVADILRMPVSTFT